MGAGEGANVMDKRIAIFDTADYERGTNIEQEINDFIKDNADDVFSLTCTHYRDSDNQFIYILVFELK